MYNKLFFTLCFSLLISNAPAQITDSISAYYPFSGNSINGDGSGLNDLQPHGSPILTEDRFGNVDCAYQFNGSDSTYLGIDSTSFYFIITYEPGWSISLWYQGGTQSISDLELLFRQGTDTSICNQLSIYDINKPFATVFSDYPFLSNYEMWSDSDSNYLGSFMDSMVWHHLTVSVDPTSFINFYVDNELQYSSILSPDVYDGCEDPIIIGKNFKGKIDDIIIYNKPLNALEVDTLFNLASFCASNPLNVSTEQALENISIYPNPVSDILTISSEQENVSYILTDILGKTIVNGKLSALQTQIDVSHIPNGMYNLTFGKNSTQTSKISILH